MDSRIENAYIEILKNELVPAFGCTEPGAIAYAASKLKTVLGQMPEHVEITCSGNIIKNVKGVVVPNSGGLRGIEASAVLGILTPTDDDELEVLKAITPTEQKQAKEIIGTGYCTVSLEEGRSGFFLKMVATKGEDEAEIIVDERHTNITFLRKNGEVLISKNREDSLENNTNYYNLLNVKDIIDFADNVDISKVESIIEPQIEYNMAIAKEGVDNSYGAQVGKTILETNESCAKTKARALAAAGSDARMGGCSMPVIVNSGSGNQGITLAVPVVVYAIDMSASREALIRALIVGNLVSVHIKRFIGTLSAFCGAVSAGTASGAAIAYLNNANYDVIAGTIINGLGNLGGVICDGAKASCAAKISSSVEAGVTAYEMAQRGRVFPFKEGIVINDVEKTIENIGRVAADGMHETDIEILNIMLEDENGR